MEAHRFFTGFSISRPFWGFMGFDVLCTNIGLIIDRVPGCPLWHLEACHAGQQGTQLIRPKKPRQSTPWHRDLANYRKLRNKRNVSNKKMSI